MQNTTSLCPEIIGANIRGLVESIAPLDSVTYWRAMQVAKLPKQSIQFDNQIAHL